MIEKYCLREDLSTSDPYDMWKTSVGNWVKDLFNCRRGLGLLPAAALTAIDTFVNNSVRAFYDVQEYPIVRALAAMSLINLYRDSNQQRHLDYAERHVAWLINHACEGYSGYCWGLGFRYPVAKGIVYDANTPFSTVTPYVLEAIVRLRQVTEGNRFNDVLQGVFRFFDRDIQVMEETDDYLATSYGPWPDRIAINSVAYTMYALATLMATVDPADTGRVRKKVQKLYAYVKMTQRDDGAWFYSPQGRSFIDCFHSCFVLKNIIKTNRLLGLEGMRTVVESGYVYLKSHLFDSRRRLFVRFSVSNKPGIVRYDLYDNAEMLNLAVLLNDTEMIEVLAESIVKHFWRGGEVYSSIDVFGVRRNRNTLRWAVMPYVYALSEMGCGQLPGANAVGPPDGTASMR